MAKDFVGLRKAILADRDPFRTQLNWDLHRSIKKAISGISDLSLLEELKDETWEELEELFEKDGTYDFSQDETDENDALEDDWNDQEEWERLSQESEEGDFSEEECLESEDDDEDEEE